MTDKYSFAGTDELGKRQDILEEFVNNMFDPEDRPWFVSDYATMYDIDAGDEDELVKRCLDYYGVDLQPSHLKLPLWQALDYIILNRK